MGGLRPEAAGEGTPLLASLDARVEAALFAAEAPVAQRDLSVLLPEGTDVAAAVGRVSAFWEGRGIRVEGGPTGWSMRAREEMLPASAPASSRRLSQAAGATLVAIAMHAPVTIPQVESIRGVRLARGIVESLEAAGLVRKVGRRSGTGRAALYEVTEAFLDWAQIDQLSDMPTLEEAVMLDLAPPARAS